MASTSNRHVDGTSGRIKTAASNIFNDNQALVGEIREVSTMIKGVAFDSEKENRSQMVKSYIFNSESNFHVFIKFCLFEYTFVIMWVKELEDAVIELLTT
ncbi:hypothetical protein MKX01_026938 [Papaver californicum]|nr:hypothetical protein MKX01_026938 [Papaver californicum]